MKKTEETAQLLAEKARMSEEEALILSKRASEAEAECQRMKITQVQVRLFSLSLVLILIFLFMDGKTFKLNHSAI